MRLIKRMANHPFMLLAAVIGTLLVGAGGFMLFEPGSFLDALYWASTTMTSVGYGDLSPASIGGRLFTIAFQLWSLFILLPCAIGNIISALLVDETKLTHDEQEWTFSALETIATKVGAELPPQPADYEGV